MKRGILTTCLLLAIFVIASSVAQGQCYRGYSSRVVTYRPVPAVTVYRPAPVVTTYRPAPVVPYRPAPVVTTYRPVYPTVVTAPAVVTARPVIVDTDVYVPGQPVRNVLRAITP